MWQQALQDQHKSLCVALGVAHPPYAGGDKRNMLPFTEQSHLLFEMECMFHSSKCVSLECGEAIVSSQVHMITVFVYGILAVEWLIDHESNVYRRTIYT